MALARSNAEGPRLLHQRACARTSCSRAPRSSFALRGCVSLMPALRLLTTRRPKTPSLGWEGERDGLNDVRRRETPRQLASWHTSRVTAAGVIRVRRRRHRRYVRKPWTSSAPSQQQKFSPLAGARGQNFWLLASLRHCHPCLRGVVNLDKVGTIPSPILDRWTVASRHAGVVPSTTASLPGHRGTGYAGGGPRGSRRNPGPRAPVTN